MKKAGGLFAHLHFSPSIKIYNLALVDSGGALPAHPPPNGIQFFHFCIHFHQKVPASKVGTPPNRKSCICHCLGHTHHTSQWQIQHFLWGVMDISHGHFLVKMYAKMKELGPIGGCAPSMPPRSTNTSHIFFPINLFLTSGWVMIFFLIPK